MEKLYTENQKHCELTKASPETIRFLLNFSKVFRITEYRQFKFENVLN
jgi:hypothetical protein